MHEREKTDSADVAFHTQTVSYSDSKPSVLLVNGARVIYFVFASVISGWNRWCEFCLNWYYGFNEYWLFLVQRTFCSLFNKLEISVFFSFLLVKETVHQIRMKRSIQGSCFPLYIRCILLYCNE